MDRGPTTQMWKDVTLDTAVKTDFSVHPSNKQRHRCARPLQKEKILHIAHMMPEYLRIKCTVFVNNKMHVVLLAELIIRWKTIHQGYERRTQAKN